MQLLFTVVISQWTANENWHSAFCTWFVHCHIKNLNVNGPIKKFGLTFEGSNEYIRNVGFSDDISGGNNSHQVNHVPPYSSTSCSFTQQAWFHDEETHSSNLWKGKLK
jgi:hypothetical protein